MHRAPTPDSDDDEANRGSYTFRYHQKLNARPCDVDGVPLPPHAPPAPKDPPPADESNNAWHPFTSRLDFDFAHFHFVTAQSSESQINQALDHWAASVLPFGGKTPWANAKKMYATIDEIRSGDAPWRTVKIRYQGPLPRGTPPKWMTEEYELYVRDALVVARNQLETTSFKGQVNTVPYQQFDVNGKRVYSNLMSGDWAWKQADIIAEDPATHGSMFVPIVAGSDKTTCSVATGHQEYHPVYMSPGILTNTARRARGNAVLPVAFLPIPKTAKRHRKRPEYQKFCRQMYHACLARVFEPLKAAMTAPVTVRCPDGHLRRAIFGLGPYIADYPEQVWLAGIVQGWCPKCDAKPDNLDAPNSVRRTQERTDWIITAFDPGTVWDDWGIRADIVPFTHDFPRADIHELLSPDLLHQVIKGTFKDHIVTWVNEYLHLVHGEARAHEIIDDIDRRIAAVPAFPGLRRFPEGRDFTQWTGDDSKALMKVYLPAIAGHVPDKMVKCLAAFLDFCYLARRNALDTDTLAELEGALSRFHALREVFIEAGVREDNISLPRQHSLLHYPRSIRLFGTPNGLCSSITESKHIQSVKKPWRRSSKWKALLQMLLTLQRLDKLSAARRVFAKLGMMAGSTLSYTARMLAGHAPEPEPDTDQDEDDEHGEVAGPKTPSSVKLAQRRESNYPRNIHGLAARIQQPRLPELTRRFLYDQLHPDAELTADDVPLDQCPRILGKISVFHSAVARFYAPSDFCGSGGMYRERIRANPDWRGEYARYDTVFVVTDAEQPGMCGMAIGRLRLLYSFTHDGVDYPCALVEWLVPFEDRPDDITGMWMVKHEYEGNGRPSMAVIHLDCIARAAHLIGVYGSSFMPENFHFSYSLGVFRAYYVNRYIDHHTHEFLAGDAR
ncbi:hypothetical protein PLICRDRAFT_180341 [Plicaturopsis crispa FD-325 SS-3]|uniref:CxC2-like cysteine cluster KDZ transposase-associated domain-containing protein n=1 Tax=Plicaturopsis crispa FD-325 SS-3 TaxID=944288 RepID=A0A0C9T622_PLICR|nr:hypothetical protein PLICRDRAFT_180341 [Plicaturopsis crispa FD-325 SS-3]